MEGPSEVGTVISGPRNLATVPPGTWHVHFVIIGRSRMGGYKILERFQASGRHYRSTLTAATAAHMPIMHVRAGVHDQRRRCINIPAVPAIARPADFLRS